MSGCERVVFDFAQAASPPWQPVGDRVMGGRSASRGELAGGALVFSGELSLAQGGGFASIRSPAADFGLDGYAGLSLRARGDGRRYKLGLRLDASFDGIVYQAPFVPGDKWGDILLPFTAFVPAYHGQPLSGAAPLAPGRIRRFGLLIADRQEGPFRLEIARITALHKIGGSSPSRGS